MTTLDITIHADPVSWSRPRRCGNRTFMDPRYVEAKLRVAMHLRLFWKRRRVDADGRWLVSIGFFCETKRRRDIDRLASLILDAAEGIVYADDSQVDFLHAGKHLGLPRGEGRTEISLRRLE